jgi:hypothetical protein
MPDTNVNFASPPDTLTTNERLAELAQILVVALYRARPSELNENSTNDRDSSLDTEGSWLSRMLARKPKMLVAIALANKMARQLWAMLTKHENYQDPELASLA